MLHTTYTQGNQGDFLLLMVGSQIVNLTPGPSFGYNLCVKLQMGHASPFYASKFHELSNDIRNFSIQWVLTLQSLS
jgi:hypothetical protein